VAVSRCAAYSRSTLRRSWPLDSCARSTPRRRGPEGRSWRMVQGGPASSTTARTSSLPTRLSASLRSSSGRTLELEMQQGEVDVAQLVPAGEVHRSRGKPR
jgi:hypothetical protein